MSVSNARTDKNAFVEALSRTIVFAFQPVVNTHTGTTFGFEALIRNYDRLGFTTIEGLFDSIWSQGIMHRADMALRELAISQFSTTPACKGKRLFFNLDGRIFESQDYHPHQTETLLQRYGLKPDHFILELSESYDNVSARHLQETLEICRQHHYKLAIDDFGRGFSEMQMLYEHQPDFVKIDRFFVKDIHEDSKKRLFVSTIVNLAHVLGTTVVAEGVETESEFLACKEIGCDLVQGYFIARPTTEHHRLRAHYEKIARTNNKDRRRQRTDTRLIREWIRELPALSASDGMSEVFESFRVNKNQSLFPVLDADGAPMGLVRETDLKDFIYLQYGRDLLQNKAFGRKLANFVTRCPIADIETEAEEILEMYSASGGTDGVIVTENFRYAGFLTADALLRILNEKNLILARDRNPLSRLPGNNSIQEYIASALDGTSEGAKDGWTFAYFDFDHFKPFNDAFGFRQGDRAIVLFAELLKREFPDRDAFPAHIGGDDFFLGFRNADPSVLQDRIRSLIATFRKDVESFYPPEARESGTATGRDRWGKDFNFDLMTCSAAILHLPEGSAKNVTSDDIADALTTCRASAKDPRVQGAVLHIDTGDVAAF